jgi:probable rRNA maturation factor
MPPFTISSTVKNYPHAPYETIKNDILGKKYSLSLTFVGKIRAQKINQISRKKDYAPNVLSFPLNENCGEIVICPEVARPEAKDFSLSKDGYLAFLFIHGLLHLKGYDHGDTMGKLEKKFVSKYRIT